MKQSVIQYSKLENDQIKIVGFNNIATLSKIRKEFGESIKDLYANSSPSYNKVNTDSIMIKNGDDELLVKIDEVVSKETFQRIISTMKLAGTRLMGIREKIDTRIHEVKI